MFAAATLTLFLGIAPVASGMVRIFLAFGMNSAAPWEMVAVSGLVTLVLGAMILARWPVSSRLGIFLSVDLICAEVSWMDQHGAWH